MGAFWRERWWRPTGLGFLLALLSLAAGFWQGCVVAAFVAGYLSGRGRAGAMRGIQAVGPAWFLWLLALSLANPVDEVVLLLGGILGTGWGAVILILVLVPVLLGLLGGLSGGYLAELRERGPEGATEGGPSPESER